MKNVLFVFCVLSLFSSNGYSQVLELAQALEAKGEKLQAIQETQGIQAAHEVLSNEVLALIEGIKRDYENQLTLISEEEAERALQSLRQAVQTKWNEADREILNLILSNRSLTPKKKIIELTLSNTFTKMMSRLESIKQDGENFGYEKTFRTIAEPLRSREQTWFKWAPVLYARNELGFVFLFLEGHMIDQVGYDYIIFRDNRTQKDYNVELTTYGLGLFLGGFQGAIIIPMGWGDLAGDYYGLHAAAGFMLSAQLGLYTNGTRLLLVVGGGLGVLGAAGVSHIQITPQE